jgi:DNA-binding NarL/FixJ family response regulator
MDRKVRVLVANRPRFLRELILGLFADEPDIEVVGEVTEPDYEHIATLIDETQPQFLILGREKVEGRPSLWEALLRRNPELKILVVADDRESIVFYWANLDIRSKSLETSEAAILEVLRSRVPQVGRFM